MGFDKKYGIVTTENVDIPDDEPVFLFRGRDVHTPEVIKYYLQRCRDGGSPQAHLDSITAGLYDVKKWQNTEGNRVRTPGTPELTTRRETDDADQSPTGADEDFQYLEEEDRA